MSKYVDIIKSKAVRLTQDMSITYPLSNEIGKLVLPSGNPKTYNIVGERIVFIDETLSVYAIPNIPGTKALLICDDYRKDDCLEVPFANREAYPTEHKEKWLSLLAEMRAST